MWYSYKVIFRVTLSFLNFLCATVTLLNHSYNAKRYLDTFVHARVEVHSRFLQISLIANFHNYCSFFVSFPLTLTVTCFYWYFFPLVRFPDYGPGCHQHQSKKTHQTGPLQALSLLLSPGIFVISSWNKIYITMISC